MSRSLFSPLAVQYQQNAPGGAPPADPTPPPATPPADPPPADPAPPAGDPPPDPAAPTFEAWIADPVNAKYVRTIRKEAADNRVKAAAATKAADATFRELAKSLGIDIPGGDPLDPAKLTEELTKTKREIVELRMGAALERAFRKHGADTDLLLPYLRGSAALEKLDPTSETFDAEVSAMVKNLLEKNPKLKASGPVPRQNGGEFPGGKPPTQQLTRDQLKGMAPEAIEAARQAGQLDLILRGGV
jgi:hypothetical protein